MKKAIAYYISAHGYGHGVRACDIIRAIGRAATDVPVVLISDLPESFLSGRLKGGMHSLRTGSFDVGMVQLDSIRVDVAKTLKQVTLLLDRREEYIRQEADYLRSMNVGVVVSDIAAIPLESSAVCGIPGVAIGNFSWDWIYEAFIERDPCWHAVVQAFREGYAKADLLLQLPLSPEMTIFPRREHLPLVASPGRERRKDLIRLTGCDPTKKWVLISFTTLDWDEQALSRVEQIENYEFFTVKPLAWKRANIHAIDRRDVSFSDVLASVDIVVSKPGFGLISECILNQKPLVYTDRSDFIEYDVLVADIRRYVQNLHIPSDEFYCGLLKPALEAVVRQPPPPERLSGGGAEIAATRILNHLGPE